MQEYLKITHTFSELHTDDGKVEVFEEGKASKAAQHRYKDIKTELESEFLPQIIKGVAAGGVDDLNIEQKHIALLDGLVNSVTSEVGRALVGLTVLQLTIKTISPVQSVRLHKGSTSRGKFSWAEGISMRVLDKAYITPVLRKYDLLRLNADGFMMTRTLAENYPYTRLYKAAVRGAKDQWVEIVDELEDGKLHPESALRYLISILINQSENFKKLVCQTITQKKKLLSSKPDAGNVFSKILQFIGTADYGARAFEVVLHCAYQALDEMGRVEGFLKPLSQMRSANKKHGNIGDIEILKSSVGIIIEEAWDAKYGKTDLREEVEELSEKLASHPDCGLAGFITDKAPIINEALARRMQDIGELHNCEIEIISVSGWYKRICAEMSGPELSDFTARWLTAIVESFGQRRRQKAPIDEPCELWLTTLQKVL